MDVAECFVIDFVETLSSDRGGVNILAISSYTTNIFGVLSMLIDVANMECDGICLAYCLLLWRFAGYHGITGKSKQTAMSSSTHMRESWYKLHISILICYQRMLALVN